MRIIKLKIYARFTFPDGFARLLRERVQSMQKLGLENTSVCRQERGVKNTVEDQDAAGQYQRRANAGSD